jgi:hypothetical protein
MAAVELTTRSRLLIGILTPIFILECGAYNFRSPGLYPILTE